MDLIYCCDCWVLGRCCSPPRVGRDSEADREKEREHRDRERRERCASRYYDFLHPLGVSALALQLCKCSHAKDHTRRLQVIHNSDTLSLDEVGDVE